MKKSAIFIVMAASVLALSGCAKVNENLVAGKVEVNTVLVKEDGTVQSALVGDLDKAYYKVDEFKAFAEEEIAKYDEKAGEDAVVLRSFEVKKKSVKVMIDYDSVGNYSAFNKMELSSMTTEDAKGLDTLPDQFISAKDGAKVSVDEALADGELKVIVVNEPLDVRVQGKVKYYSNGDLLNDTAVQTSEEGTAFLIYKP